MRSMSVKNLNLTAVVSLTALVAVAAFTSEALAASVTVKGKVRANTVVNVVDKNGQAKSKKAKNGSFQIKLPSNKARGATVQLLSSKGKYLGPVVLAKSGKKAYLGLGGKSVDLGSLKIRKGYARASAKLGSGEVDKSKTAKTTAAGKPLGASKFGVVRAKGKKASIAADRGGSGEAEGADPDRDGITSAFDADDDGDLVLDSSDSDESGESGGVFSTLYVSLPQTLNVNVPATGVSSGAIDSLITSNLNVIFYFDDSQFGSVSGGSINCFTLSYCNSAVISGLSESGSSLPRGARWDSYHPGGSSYPGLEELSSSDGRSVHAMSILPNATTSQIRGGDAYQAIFRTGSGEVIVPRVLPPYFITSPAVTTYDAGAGSQSIPYPSGDTPGADPSNPIALTGSQLTLSLHRPQRLAIAGAESGEYTDMGNLHYGVVIQTETQEIGCPGSYSGLSSTLREESSSSDFSMQLFPLTDSTPDGAPGSASQLSFTLDLAGCLSRAGMSSTGAQLMLSITAAGESRPGGLDRSAQMIYVRTPG